MALTSIPRPPPRLNQPIADDQKFVQIWYGWFSKLALALQGNLAAGFTGTITTAKLTGGGANGSMTFTNGVLTSETAAT